jgi:hypothetical protein
MSQLPGAFFDVLRAGGLNLFAILPAATYDAAGPPAGLSTGGLFPDARSIVVVGSGGRALWPCFLAWLQAAPQEHLVHEPDPLDTYVGALLDRAEQQLEQAGIRRRRFEAAFRFQPRLDFRRIGELCGLGGPSPIGLLIHPGYGPWWALRAAWFVNCELAPSPHLARACEGCPAPCRAAIANGTEGTLLAATREARLACHLSAERYEDEQCVFHHDQDAGRAHLKSRLGV